MCLELPLLHFYQQVDCAISLKGLGVHRSSTATWRASDALSALALPLRAKKNLLTPTQVKKNNKQKCLLKSSYLHCAIYLFPMGRHPNGRRLGRSSKALSGMSSSNAGHYPASLIILIVPPYRSFLAPQSLDKPRCPWWPETNTWRSRCGFLWPRSVLFTGSAWLPSVQIRGYRQAGQGSSGTHCCVVRCPDVLRIFTQPSALSGGGGTDS